METLNQAMFLYLNAPAHLGATVLLTIGFLAEGLIWLIPIGLLFGWFRGGDATRKAMIEATVAAALALLLAQLIGMVWVHPRPFMIGMGHTYLVHVADASFPSDHLTPWWTVSFSLITHSGLRAAGVLLGLLGIVIAWARIYLGVHFPLDMAGAAALALVCNEGLRQPSSVFRRAAVCLGNGSAPEHAVAADPARLGAWLNRSEDCA